MKEKTFISFLIASILAINTMAQVKVYKKPQADMFPVSKTFQVEVSQGNSKLESANVFQYHVPEKMVTKTENIAMFGFEPDKGAVTAQVSMVDGTLLNEDIIEVVNKSLPDLTWGFENGKLWVSSASAKRQILIRFKNDYSNQLLLFIDPLHEREIPETAKVVTFSADNSPHVIKAEYDCYNVPNDVDVVHIEEGAVLMGTIHTSAGRNKPLTIMGRGIIIGNGPMVKGMKGMPYNAIELPHGEGHIVEGITSFSPRHFTIRAPKNSLISNVKMFGYDSNIDGIVAGENSIIEHCYSKVNDDHIKLYKNNITVRYCTFYQQTNGAVFQFAWNRIVPGSNCLVENCEIVAWEANCGDPGLNQGGFARSFINLRETSAGSISGNNIFRNIYIQGVMPRFVCINGKYSGSKPLTLNNIVLENITLEHKPTSYSWLYTGDDNHHLSFIFRNVKMGGECLSETIHEFKTEGKVNLTFEGCD